MTRALIIMLTLILLSAVSVLTALAVTMHRHERCMAALLSQPGHRASWEATSICLK